MKIYYTNSLISKKKKNIDRQTDRVLHIKMIKKKS